MDRLTGGKQMKLRSGFAFLVVAMFMTAHSGQAAPLPDPLFTGGGFNAPSADVLKQEELANALLGAYLKARGSCDRIAVGQLQLAYQSSNLTKVPGIQAAWQACLVKTDAYYAGKRDRLLLKGMPACLDQAGIDAQRALVDQLIATLGAQIYCDGGGAAPDPVTGIDIPDKKQETIGETAVAQIVLRRSGAPPSATRRPRASSSRRVGCLTRFRSRRSRVASITCRPSRGPS
jgi:hypothetical protein